MPLVDVPVHIVTGMPMTVGIGMRVAITVNRGHKKHIISRATVTGTLIIFWPCPCPYLIFVTGTTDDGEDVFYKLPGAKKRQAKNKHNLMDAVTNVRGAEKKH